MQSSLHSSSVHARSSGWAITLSRIVRLIPPSQRIFWGSILTESFGMMGGTLALGRSLVHGQHSVFFWLLLIGSGLAADMVGMIRGTKQGSWLLTLPARVAVTGGCSLAFFAAFPALQTEGPVSWRLWLVCGALMIGAAKGAAILEEWGGHGNVSNS